MDRQEQEVEISEASILTVLSDTPMTLPDIVASLLRKAGYGLSGKAISKADEIRWDVRTITWRLIQNDQAELTPRRYIKIKSLGNSPP